MSYLSLILSVSFLHLLALISPGPDFIMTIRNSLTYSRKTGIMTAIGFGLGIAVHIFYCVAGMALIISQSILVFNAIKLLGAGYLIYIGIKSILAKADNSVLKSTSHKKDISPLQAIKIGFLTNVLNPKATLFFLGLFSIVIVPATPVLVIGIVSFIMIIMTIVWFSLVAIFFTHTKTQQYFQRFQGVINKTLGGLLIILGIKVAFLSIK